MFFYNRAFRSILYQFMLLAGLILAFVIIRQNLVDNLASRNITTGYTFLSSEASFGISETPIEYSPADSYTRAFIVGALNTLKVSFIGGILAITLGLIVGIFLLSKNWLLRNVSYTYINLVRNTPLILQLFLWYLLITEFLPLPNDSTRVGGFFFTNRGLFTPALSLAPYLYWIFGLLAFSVVASILISYFGAKYHDKTGKIWPVYRINLSLFIASILIPVAFNGFRIPIEIPSLHDGNINYGTEISPEFLTILFGLVVYTATFIAEIVRSGILAVPKGQTEAGVSIGLRPTSLLRLIILPQAMRVIIPPLTNQLLNLFKNSTLAVAIGFPDFVSVVNTAMNQTGQAIEGVSLLMVFYLSGSLIVSASMNWFNHKMRIVER